MKVTKRDLLRLYNAIMIMEGRQFSVKFSYFIAKNKVAMRDEITALDEARQVSDTFKTYDAERAKMAQEYADKNEDGSAKIQDNSFVITANLEEFQTALEALRKQYKEAIEEREQQLKDFEELLDEKVTFKGARIDFKDIPPTVEPTVLEVLILADLIIEDEDQ